ncbi:MAG: hypothetical protein PHE84_09195 [bacterium]|nr:hypothetical protein [bacterium]
MICHKRTWGWMLLLLAFFLFSSCLEYDEEMVLNKNGSGSLQQIFRLENRFHDNLLKSGNFSMTREVIEKSLPPGSKLLDFSDLPMGNQHRIISVTIHFDDFMTVLEMAGQGKANFIGEIKWEKDYLGRIKYRRTLKKKGETVFGGKGDSDALIKYGMGKGMMGNFTMNFNFTGPYRVVRSNAQKVEGERMSWVVPVVDLLDPEKEVVLTALLEKPSNVVLIGSIYGVVILGVFAVILFFIKRKKY